MSTLVAKKKFGQNFLVDTNAQLKVALIMEKLANGYPDRFIVEIGPGRGDLTKYFVEFKKDLLALEIDIEAIELLQIEFANYSNFELIKTDATKVLNGQEVSVFEKLSRPFVLLSSLPYNVGSRILVDLAVSFPNTPFAVILQKEVISKAAGKDGFTFFGAWLNLFWDLKNTMSLSPNVFSPKPKIYSGLMVGVPKKVDLLDKYLQTKESREAVKNVLKKLFANPSKTLVNNLKNTGLDSTQISEFMQKYQLDPKTRLNWLNYEQILSFWFTNYFK